VLEVIRIFSELKKAGRSVCLLVANQWATTRTHKEAIGNYEYYAHNCGLTPAEFCFTSTLGKDREVGISQQAIRDLFLLSNLFIFPTREESFGLVVPEAGLSGCMMVLNKSLQMQAEISGYNALYFDFGSFTHNFQCEDEDKYYKEIAHIIAGKMQQDTAIKCKTFFRQNNNRQSLYKKYYAPIMGEAETW
jgi:hypothetical protein